MHTPYLSTAYTHPMLFKPEEKKPMLFKPKEKKRKSKWDTRPEDEAHMLERG